MVLPGRESVWHAVPALDAVQQLKSNSKDGLKEGEVRIRREKYGTNTFDTQEKRTFFIRFREQFKSPLLLILLGAGIITLFLRDFGDTLVIVFALLISIFVGIFQEGRASLAFEKLVESQKYSALVIRDGHKQRLERNELVRGDIVVLEAGGAVPADCRLIEAENLEINEAVLTGEWMGIPKNTQLVGQGESLSHRSNMVWMGTLIAGGAGKGVVVATGRETQIGSIAGELALSRQQKTPLQKNTEQLARFLSWLILGIVSLLFVLGIVRGEPLTEMLLLAVAVAVSVIPEGLPAAVTIVLAVGMERILKKGGLVRNLLAAETLGGTTVILTDKTGTLTEARMAVSRIVTLASGEYGVVPNSISEDTDATEILRGAVLTSDAFIEEGTGAIQGRPVESAILEVGRSVEMTQANLAQTHTTLAVMPFSNKARFAGALVSRPRTEKYRFYATGAPETLMASAKHVLVEGKTLALSDKRQTELTTLLNRYTEKGMRLIGVSYTDGKTETDVEQQKQNPKKLLVGGVFMGFIALADPIRSDVAEAIKEVQSAGARVIMLTGDNPETGCFVAEEVGIAKKGEKVRTGEEIENMSDEELLKELQTTHVFARVVPQQKMRIAELLQKDGEIVAMTGDGVNDAPALRRAHIGIAVGSGTEVAKEASDLILLKDSFAIIASAIREGRRIIDNLKKIVSHLLSTSFGEVFVIGGAIIAGLPLPILPAQILWLNLIEEGLLSFAFAFEPAERGVMKQDPRSDQVTKILTPDVRFIIFISGTVTGIMLLGLYFLLESLGTPLAEIRTFIFVGLSLDALIFSFGLKHLRLPIWRTNIFSNTYLLVAFAISAGLLAVTLLYAPLRDFLSLVVITPFEVTLLVGVGIVDLIAIEVAKKLSVLYTTKKLRGNRVGAIL